MQPTVALDGDEAKMNRVFEDTDFTFKSAIDTKVAIRPTLHQQKMSLTREHNSLMKKLGDDDPIEKMNYLRAKM